MRRPPFFYIEECRMISSSFLPLTFYLFLLTSLYSHPASQQRPEQTRGAQNDYFHRIERYTSLAGKIDQSHTDDDDAFYHDQHGLRHEKG